MTMLRPPRLCARVEEASVTGKQETQTSRLALLKVQPRIVTRAACRGEDRGRADEGRVGPLPCAAARAAQRQCNSAWPCQHDMAHSQGA